MEKAEFIKCLEKEPKERAPEELDIICLQLRELAAFQPFHSHQLSHFASVAKLQYLEEDQILFSQGEEGNEWYIVYLGAVDITVDGQFVCSFGAGSGFGDVAILENSPRTATVKTKEKCTLLKIPGDVFRTLYRDLQSSKEVSLDDISEHAEETEHAEEHAEEHSEPIHDKDEKADDESVFNYARRGSVDTLKDFRAVIDIKPEDRGPDDILDLLDEISRIKAFSHLSSSILRELCSCLIAQYVQPNEILFKQGDEGTCWYIIYKGKVDVLVNGVTVCTLADGDGFGDLALIHDKPRSATIKAVEECHLIKIEKADYNRILKDIESNTIRLEEHGQEVVVLEKRLDSATKTHGYVLMSGTPEWLVKQLEENNEADPTYAADFLIAFHTFMTGNQVMDFIIHRIKNSDSEGDKASQTKVNQLKKFTAVIKLWIVNHTIDFLTEPSLVDRVLEVVDILSAAGLEGEINKLVNVMMTKKLDTKGRTAGGSAPTDQGPNYVASALSSEEPGKVTLRKKNSVKGMFKRGFGRLSTRTSSSDNISQLTLPSEDSSSSLNIDPTNPKELVKVYLDDETYKTIEVGLNTSGAEVLTIALAKFNKIGDKEWEPSQYELCEAKSDGSFRLMDEAEISLVSKMSLGGKFLIRKKGSSSALTFPTEPQHIPTFDTDSPFLEIEMNELARVMTLLDHQAFCKIDPLEFVYHIYKIKGKDTSNLNNFVNRFNRVNYWVITEVCSQKNLQKRVKIISKFIKLSVCFKLMNNYNALFAVLSGLSNVAVSRMQNTWRKIPARLFQEFESLTKLMDPSRNMKIYRTHVLNATPPLVPFFPIVIKDLFFIHECNPSKTNSGLINFDKLRLLASIIRFVDAFRYVQYDPNIQPQYDPKKRRSTLEMLNEAHLEKAQETHQIREFVNTLTVVDNMRLLSKMSREAEAQIGRTKRSASIPRIILGL